jgi:ribulose bisphosphate carboxylase small subunit
MLNFVTKEALSEMENKTNDANDDYIAKDEPSVESIQQQEGVQDAIAERREVASDENYEPVRILSADEIKETAETQGFAF